MILTQQNIFQNSVHIMYIACNRIKTKLNDNSKQLPTWYKLMSTDFTIIP